jgi:CRP/FNR family transcriptional regulator, anaerobic regulatory protein
VNILDASVLNTLKLPALGFEPELILELDSNSALLSFEYGQVVMDIGQTIKMIPLVISGIFKISRVNDEGQEVLLYYMGKGESCSMAFTHSMMSQPSMVRATVEEDATLLYIPVGLSEEWMVKYSSWKKFVMFTIQNQFMSMVKAFEDFSSKKTDERLINYLKQKSSITGSKLINLSHQQIADEMGTNRVVISRLLKKFENDNKVLLFRNQIKLLKDM